MDKRIGAKDFSGAKRAAAAARQRRACDRKGLCHGTRGDAKKASRPARFGFDRGPPESRLHRCAAFRRCGSATRSRRRRARYWPRRAGNHALQDTDEWWRDGGHPPAAVAARSRSIPIPRIRSRASAAPAATRILPADFHSSCRAGLALRYLNDSRNRARRMCRPVSTRQSASPNRAGAGRTTARCRGRREATGDSAAMRASIHQARPREPHYPPPYLTDPLWRCAKLGLTGLSARAGAPIRKAVLRGADEIGRAPTFCIDRRARPGGQFCGGSGGKLAATSPRWPRLAS